MSALIHPDRLATARRVLALAESQFLLPEQDLAVGAFSAADDMRSIADAFDALKGRLESTLNLAIKNAEMSARCRRDCQGDVDTIGEAFDELIGLLRHAAGEVEENDRLPREAW